MTKAEIIALIKARTTTSPFQVVFQPENYDDYCDIVYSTYTPTETISHCLPKSPYTIALRIGKLEGNTHTGSLQGLYSTLPIVDFTPTLPFIFTRKDSTCN